MDIFKNLRHSLTVRNAVRQPDGFKGYNSSQLNDYNGFNTDVYTRNSYTSYFYGVNKHGKYDNYFGDYNRIIQVAPTYPFYYVKKDEIVDKGDFVEYLEKPNTTYPQFKVWQQIYSEMITNGYSDIFLWRKDGKNETNIFDDKQYKEDDFRGITLVSGYSKSRLSSLEKKNIVRITYGASQDNVFVGYSPSQAAQSWRKMQDEMGLHMTAFAKNAGMPIGKFIITAPSPEDYVKMRDSLDNKISGAKNAGKILYDYRPSESKVSQIEWVQFTSQDVQDYTKQLEFAEKKMSQNFGVPGTVKGTNDGENYATARVSEHIFIKYTIKSLILDFQMQLVHALEQRFSLEGEIKVNIPLPEIADESLVKIRATERQVVLFDQKIAEGYTAQSIVDAYGLPESFLLLEREADASNASNSVKKASKRVKHSHEKRDEFVREYQNFLTKKERADIEEQFRSATKDYADAILEEKYSKTVRSKYEGTMAAIFTDNYAKIYDKYVDKVGEALADTLDSVDIADLELTDEELEYARDEYKKRVEQFSETFAKDVAALPGETMEVRQKGAEPNIKRVVVTESEHTRIVSELKSWTKAQEDFPVRVYKTWNARAGACPECIELDKIQIDVTALFVGRNDPNFNEIYEVQGGGLHPNCRCYCQYEMEKDV